MKRLLGSLLLGALLAVGTACTHTGSSPSTSGMEGGANSPKGMDRQIEKGNTPGTNARP